MRGGGKRKRGVLIISDGGDNNSRYTESDVRNFVKEADCQLYSIGLFDANDQRRTVEELYGPTLLSEITQLTGGRLFPPPSPNKTPWIPPHVGLEPRTSYPLGYQPGH